jgi:hypothetical protein
VIKVENYERELLNLFCSEYLSNSVLFSAINHPSNITCKFTGEAYHLEIQHSELPDINETIELQNVFATFEDSIYTFVVFIEKGIVCLSCFNKNHSDGVPDRIRNGSVVVTAT